MKDTRSERTFWWKNSATQPGYDFGTVHSYTDTLFNFYFSYAVLELDLTYGFEGWFTSYFVDYVSVEPFSQSETAIYSVHTSASSFAARGALTAVSLLMSLACELWCLEGKSQWDGVFVFGYTDRVGRVFSFQAQSLAFWIDDRYQIEIETEIQGTRSVGWFR